MVVVPEELRQRLRQFDQEHVLAWWDQLPDSQRQELIGQLQALDLEELQRLYRERNRGRGLPAWQYLEPLAYHSADMAVEKEALARAVEALRGGQVAALVVAGGQGSRLGFEHPKGMFPIGPVTNKSLFQVHAEKVLALQRRHQAPWPFLIMTSPATHEETLAFFAAHDYFGLPRDEVWFFRQGTMPALDLATGQLLLESPGKLFVSPNGHGGTLTGLAECGLLDRLVRRGIRTLFYFQVDNPLVRIADPAFLGQHLLHQAEVSNKVVVKESSTDQLGNFVLVDGRLTIVEYSDLPATLAGQVDEQGRLRLWAGSPAIHLFDLDFLQRVTQDAGRLPWHVACKKVPYLDAAGQLVQPAVENALKFERFIFDLLPLAQRWTVQAVNRQAEFAPLKNAGGPDSPPAVRQALSDQAADWLERAGVMVPRRADGSAAVNLEISPLFALDAAELAAKVPRGLRLEKPTYFQ